MTQENSQATEQKVEAPQKDTKDINLDRMRKALEQERIEKQKMQERLAELERHANAKQSVSQSHEDDDDSDEPYVDHRKLKKSLTSLKEDLKKSFKEEVQQEARTLIEQERQQSYIKANPDFQETLTQENIEKFAQKHPQIAERMLRMPDNFDRQALLYEQIKALQIGKKEEPKQSVQQTIDANRRSPFYHPSGVGTQPYAQTGDFSPAGQKAAYEKLKELKGRLRI